MATLNLRVMSLLEWTMMYPLNLCQDTLTFCNVRFFQNRKRYIWPAERCESRSKPLDAFLSGLPEYVLTCAFVKMYFSIIHLKHNAWEISLMKITLHMYKGKQHTEFWNQNMASCLIRNQIQIHGREAQLQTSRLLHVSLGNVTENIKRQKTFEREREKESEREEDRERNPSLCWDCILTIKRLATQSNPKLFLHMLVPLLSTGLSDAAILN